MSHHDRFLLPIPGTTSIAHLEENVAAAEITLADSEVALLSSVFAPERISGDRYPAMALSKVQI